MLKWETGHNDIARTSFNWVLNFQNKSGSIYVYLARRMKQRQN